jgi:dynein heavy chain, axonemal
MFIFNLQAYADDVREEWVKAWPGQVVLCVSQVYWTSQVHAAITASNNGLLTLWNDLQVK